MHAARIGLGQHFQATLSPFKRGHGVVEVFLLNAHLQGQPAGAFGIAEVVSAHDAQGQVAMGRLPDPLVVLYAVGWGAVGNLADRALVCEYQGGQGFILLVVDQGASVLHAFEEAAEGLFVIL